MLTRLYIENVAVIEKTEIFFDDGLNVLTGETGAGKSVIINSINAVLGRKVSKEIIREGAKSAFVSATFSELSTELLKVVENYGFVVDENDELIVQRELSTNGKTIARINGRPAAISVLKSVGEKLINIHGQHENIGLLSQQTHLNFIDEFGRLRGDLENYSKSYDELLKIRQQLNKLNMDENEKARRIDLLEYQIQELESADLKVGETESLGEKRTYLLNKEKITNSIEHVKNLLNGDDEYNGAVSLFELAGNELAQLENIYPPIKNLSDRFKELIYEVSDCQSELISLSPDVDLDINELNDIEERLTLISCLSKKYGDTVSDMLNFLREAKSELEKIQTSEHEVKQLRGKLVCVEEKANKLAHELSVKRHLASCDFIKKVKDELAFLDMPKVIIEVSQKDKELSKFGRDDIEILISTNPGQHPRPIFKIASGGELSRLMLAIKNVLSNEDDVQTLIFDEIDTGISGAAAQKVGMKLKSLSKSRQVVCVTHLAQIAVLADQHFLITKNVTDDKTFTEIKKLNFNSRKKEIARIIGGTNVTPITLKNAEEMLENSMKNF